MSLFSIYNLRNLNVKRLIQDISEPSGARTKIDESHIGHEYGDYISYYLTLPILISDTTKLPTML